LAEFKKPADFRSFVESTHWDDVSTYLNTAQQALRTEIEVNARNEAEFRGRLKEKLTGGDFSKNLHEVTKEDLLRARDVLRNDVCAVDGTLAKVELLSGTRSQIGIVAVNYQNERATHVTYVTEASYSQYNSSEDVLDSLQSKKKEKRVVSDLVLRATMAYFERKHALRHSAKWKILHGELFPFELRSGLGELKALDTTIALFREVASQPTIGSVVSDTGSIDKYIGYAIEPFHYFIVESLKREYDDWLQNDAHFSKMDQAKFQVFVDEVAGNYYRAVYRVGPRPFVFFAHKDYIHEFASILMADASLVPERGFPILVDYADSMCSSLFRAGDFDRRIQHELALQGEFLREQSERAFRQH